MKEQNDIKLSTSRISASVYGITLNRNKPSSNIKELKRHLQQIKLSDYKVNEPALHSLTSIKNKTLKNVSPLSFSEEPELTHNLASKNLFRFFVKNGEHVYGRPNDIIMIESCDHLVNVYLAFNDKIKKAIRTNTLKDFLSLLPADQFTRIGRFCAINISRLSGGSFIDQTFEFDFRISVKLKHALSQHVFKNIGK